MHGRAGRRAGLGHWPRRRSSAATAGAPGRPRSREGAQPAPGQDPGPPHRHPERGRPQPGRGARLARSSRTTTWTSRGWPTAGSTSRSAAAGSSLEGRHRSLEMLRGGPAQVEGAHCTGPEHRRGGHRERGHLLDDRPATRAVEPAAPTCAPTSASSTGSPPTEIYGHRDFKNTACPGDRLYTLLPRLRTDVAALLAQDDDSSAASTERRGRCCGVADRGPDVQAAQHLLRGAGTDDVVPDGRLRPAHGRRGRPPVPDGQRHRGGQRADRRRVLAAAGRTRPARRRPTPGDTRALQALGAARRGRTGRRHLAAAARPGGAPDVAADPDDRSRSAAVTRTRGESRTSGVGTLPDAGSVGNWRRCAITRTQAVPGSRSIPEAAVAGSPVARRLVREAMTAPDGLRRVDVVGPGGQRQDRAARRARRRRWHAPASHGPPGAARPRRGARRRTPRCWSTTRTAAQPGRPARLTGWPPAAVGDLVVAHRPWPRPDRHRRARRGPGRAPPAGRARRAGPHRGAGPGHPARAGRPGRPGAATGLGRTVIATGRLVTERTAGVPVLVDRLLDALIEQGGDRPTRSRWTRAARRRGLLAQLGLHRAPPRTACGPAAARALGAPLEAEVLVPVLGLTGGRRRAGRARSKRPAPPACSPRTGAPSRWSRPPCWPAPRPAPGSSCAGRWPRSSSSRGGNVRAAARGLLGTGRERRPGGGCLHGGRRRVAAHRRPGAGEFLAAAVRRRGRPGRSSWPPAAPRPRRAGRRSRPRAHPGRPGASAAGPGAGRRPGPRRRRWPPPCSPDRGMLARSAELYRWLGARMGTPRRSRCPR